MSEIYIPQATKFSAKVVIVNPLNEVLLGLRSEDDADRPGTLDLFGGGVKKGETSLQAAVRETREETGLDFPASAFRLACVAPDVESKYGHTNRRYIFRLDIPMQRPDLQLQPLEHQDAIWRTELDAYNALVHPEHRKALAWAMRLPLLVAS